MKIRVEGTDLRGVIEGMRALGKAAPEAAMRILGQKAQDVAAKARTLCPDDPGTPGSTLRDSIRATKATRGQSGMISAAVIVGGSRLKGLLGSRAYNAIAVVQHEDMTLKHSHGQAKFLEQPFLQTVPSVADAVQAALDQEADRVAG